ncbi:MAG: hypothetical protein Q9171_002466 [Xanthocarpia ochracea]
MGASSKVIDWAEQQSSQSSGPTTQPSYEAYSPAPNPEQSRSIKGAGTNTARAYSIASLLRIENIFKIASSSGSTKQQENLRPRGLARSSNLTGESTNSGEDSLYDGTFTRPFRQPLNPPEATLIQKHAGFARFLKQHASPPHHRVTAGGRIVPAGPLSPPLFQLLPSINAVVANPHSRSLAGKDQANFPEASTKGSDNPKTPTVTAALPLAPQNVNTNRPRPFNISHPASVINNVGTIPAAQMQIPLINQFGTNLGPLPPGATPIGFLPDGSPLVYFNGVNYQSYWDGTSTILKPLQLSVPQLGYNAQTYPPMSFGQQSYGFHNSTGFGYPQDATSSLQFTDGINDARDQSQHLDMASSQDLVLLHNQLSSQLMTLDKYVALHLHEFSSTENARCTAMRRLLIEQLDSLRMRMMDGAYAAAPWPAANGPTEATNLTSGVTVSANHLSVEPTTPVLPQPVVDQSYGMGLNGSFVPPPKASKCLSPDAPPFVPGMNAALPDHILVSQRSKPSSVQIPERRKEHGYVDECRDYAVGRHQGHEGKPDQEPQKAGTDSGKGSSRSRRPVFIDHGSIDDLEIADLLPQVSLSEIEYASAPGFNPPDGPKVYCTKTSEFQEVIRRVRQQAQMYGCKGGQSKDPAYDAEQDVRWAMADGEPIPLPRSPADHLANPRPWSWDDSAFNCRRNAEDIVEHDVLQKSTKSTGSANRSRADSWIAYSQIDEFDKRDSSKSTTGESATRPNNLSSSLRIRKQSSSHNEPGANRSIRQPYSHIGHMADKAASSIADCMTTWKVNNGDIKQLVSQLASPGGIVRPRDIHKPALDNPREQYQAYLIKDSPKTPTKTGDPTGYLAASPSLDERSRGTQHLWHSPNRVTARPDTKSTHYGTKSHNSWDSNTERNHLLPRMEDQATMYPKRGLSSQPNQQGFGEGVKPSRFTDAENDALSFDSQGIPYSEIYDRGTFARSKPKAVKVNLPPACGHPTLTETEQGPEERHIEEAHAAQLVQVRNDDKSPGFLRGLLKSPRYSAVRAHKSEPFDLMPSNMDFGKSSQQEPAKRLANKENVRSDDYHDTISAYGRGYSPGMKESPNRQQSAVQDVLAHKARSSLAASSYQAVGRLPQYDGAGDALVSSNRQADGTSGEHRRSNNNNVRSAGDSNSENPSSRRQQAKLYEVAPTGEYDYRGLTRKDFIMASDRPSDRSGHYQHVDRFLNRLREEELQEVSAQHGREPAEYRRL